MSYEEMVATVRILYGDANLSNEVVGEFLQVAEHKALNRIYPFGNGEEELPSKYSYDVCELAVRLLSRRGGEGEVQHSENGVARIYNSVDDNDILSRFMPVGKVC